MSTGAANGYVMTSDASGLASWTPASTIAGQNIYNTDGTLTGNRTVTMGADNLTFNSSGGNVLVSSGGYVGVGTDAPASSLSVAASGNSSHLSLAHVPSSVIEADNNSLLDVNNMTGATSHTYYVGNSFRASLKTKAT
jgi:hypothetical protein